MSGRRAFLKKALGAGGVAVGVGEAPPASPFVPAHNWDRHDPIRIEELSVESPDDANWRKRI